MTERRAAVDQVARLVGRTIDQEVARALVEQRRRAVELLHAAYGSPSARQLLDLTYEGLRHRMATAGPGSWAGAAQLLRSVAIDLDVPGARDLPQLHRTRGQVDQFPPAHRRREGAAVTRSG